MVFFNLNDPLWLTTLNPAGLEMGAHITAPLHQSQTKPCKPERHNFVYACVCVWRVKDTSPLLLSTIGVSERNVILADLIVHPGQI